MAGDVTIGVQADPAVQPEWAAFARRVEDLGFDGLLVADHPGSGAAPSRANYRFIIGGWFTWCASDGHHPLGDADPRMIERWITSMQQRPYAANTAVGTAPLAPTSRHRCH